MFNIQRENPSIAKIKIFVGGLFVTFVDSTKFLNLNRKYWSRLCGRKLFHFQRSISHAAPRASCWHFSLISPSSDSDLKFGNFNYGQYRDEILPSDNWPALGAPLATRYWYDLEIYWDICQEKKIHLILRESRYIKIRSFSNFS